MDSRIVNKLVSIITPCYNVSKKINRFLVSISNQTYKNIEIIFVDDGSSDNTKEIILSYKDKFEEVGIIFKYVWQENQGLAAAINRGLLEVSGEYLIWPDPDDWLENDSIEQRVNFLERYPEYDIVTSNANIYMENNSNLLFRGSLVKIVDKNVLNENQFYLLLHYQSIFCSGCHMVRMDVFRETHKNTQIYNGKRGQNFQMLLPLYYSHKRYFLNKNLYNYVIYKDSMSRGDDSLEKEITRANELLDILQNTINKIEEIPDIEKKQLIEEVYNDDLIKKFRIACKYRNFCKIQKYYNKLKEKKLVDKRIKITYIRAKSSCIDFFFKVAYFPIRVVKKLIGLVRK